MKGNDSLKENNTQKKKREIDVGGWVSAPFATRIDRDWLDQDAPQSQLNSVKAYVPQPGDTILYYPAGHFEFLNKYPDYLCNEQTIDRIPLWERAAKERAKAFKGQGSKKEKNSSESKAAASSWWTHEWIDNAGSGKDILPILCRVVKTQAEFPRDSSQDPDDDNNNQRGASAAANAASQSKAGKRPVLRLAVTLRPLTPINPPSWTDAGPDDTESMAAPPLFTCVTFPSPLQAFMVPFAWAYIRNQSIVGKYVLNIGTFLF